MDERKIILIGLSVLIYCLYSVSVWFTKEIPIEVNIQEIPTTSPKPEIIQPIQTDNITKNETKEVLKKIKTKTIPLYVKNGCSILQIFLEKPPATCKENKTQTEPDNNALTVMGITFFLIILILNAVLDVIKVKEEERAKRKLNPDGERRQSLAEFANKKPLRRESSKFGLQLFQIAESISNVVEEKAKSLTTRRQIKQYTRGDSTNSYLSDKKIQSESTPASVGDTASSEPKLVKRQSVAKLFGGRPVPMVRRSSFPALPLNPDIQALMLGHKQPSFDSDDEVDGRGRRVRIIRRF